MRTPRGIANNNPTNMRPSADVWQGMRSQQTDPGFLQFVSPEMGIRAAAKNLLTYRKRGLDTVHDVVMAWAPPVDKNDTAVYIAHVASALGVGADDVIDVRQPAVMLKLLRTLTIHENGRGPLPGGDWYEERVYRAGMVAAGVKL